MRRRIAASTLMAAALMAAAGCGPSAAQTDTWSPIAVTAAPFTMAAPEGGLIFRAGFVLSSDQARFGGLSGLHVFEDGRLVAVTDSGEWFAATLTRDPATGVPTGLRDARMALMRDEAGEFFPNKESGDAEDLAVLADGRIAVSFEQTQTLRIYDLFGVGPGAGPGAAAKAGPALADTDGLNRNRGLEALALLPDGTLLAGAEMGRRGAPSPLWRVGLDATDASEPQFRLRAAPGFGLTGLAYDAGRGVLIGVQRFYAPGFGVRIRVFTAPVPEAGEEVTATTLAELAPPLPVDNVEAVSVLPLANGGSRIFLISDNNFSDDQETQLHVFDWPAASRP